MNLTSTPSKIQIPFANATTYKYTIPVASQIGTDVRKASYVDGFPPLTMEPISSGGVAPYGQDFNGVLNQLSAGLRWEQSNTPFKFDNEFCTSIGGYPLGAKLLSADNTHYWINQVADNTANPDTAGTNWVSGEYVSTGYYPKATTADKWTTARTLSFTGDVAGSGSVDGSGNVSFAMTGVQAAKWKNPRTLSFTGFATGSGSVDGSGDVSIALSMGSGSLRAMNKTLLLSTSSVNSSVSVSLPPSLFGGATPSFVVFSANANSTTVIDTTGYILNAGTSQSLTGALMACGTDDTDQGNGRIYAASTFILPYSSTQNFYISAGASAAFTCTTTINLVGYQL